MVTRQVRNQEGAGSTGREWLGRNPRKGRSAGTREGEGRSSQDWQRRARYRLVTWALVLASLIVFVAIWQGIVLAHLAPPLVLPGPLGVWRALVTSFTEPYLRSALLHDIWLTFEASVVGFLVAVAVGLFLGIVIAQIPVVRRAVSPLVVASNAAPKIAFAPLFVAWFGFGVWSKVWLAVLIAFFPVFINTVAGVNDVDEAEVRLFRIMHASSVQELAVLRLPKAAGYIFSGMRTAVVLSVLGVIVGQFVGGGKGLGELIVQAAGELDVSGLLVYVIIACVLSYAMYLVVAWAEKRIVFWRDRSSGEAMSATA